MFKTHLNRFQGFLCKKLGFRSSFCNIWPVKAFLATLLLFLFLSEESSAQYTVSQNKTSISSISKSKSSSNSKSFSSRNKLTAAKKKKALTTTLSLSEQQNLSTQKWSLLVGSSAVRSLDELSDYFGTLEISGTYKLNKKLLLVSSLSYEYILMKESGAFIVTEDDPREYGIGDLNIGITYPRAINLPQMKSFVNFSANLSLPTSTNSRDASQYFMSSFSASMISVLTPKLVLRSFTSLLVASHEFDDSDIFGNQVNSPLGLRYGFSGFYTLIKGLSAFSSFSIYSRYEYDENIRNIQSFSSGLQYAVTNKMFVTGAYFWRDQFESNDLAFDDDNSFYSIGIEYSL